MLARRRHHGHRCIWVDLAEREAPDEIDA